MQDEVRASLEDLAIRWETPKGRELKAKIVQDVKKNRGEGIPDLLRDFLYVSEVPHGRDLRCITLEGEDLSDAVFGKCDLSWCSFARSNLQRADLRNASLKRADLTDANLSMARFEGAELSRVDFSRSQLDGTHFKESKCTGAVFEGCDAQRASFESAQLTKCNFKGAKLAQANFFNADVNNSNFDGNGLDSVAARPAKAWGLRYGVDREEFEKQVGLNAITSRTTKKFKALDALLKIPNIGQATEKPAEKKQQDDIPVFGASLRGTQKLKVQPQEEEPIKVNPLMQPKSEREGEEPPLWGRSAPTRRGEKPTVAYDQDRVGGGEGGDPGQRPTTAYPPGEDDDAGAPRRAPPPPRPTLRRPGGPPTGATPAGGIPRPPSGSPAGPTPSGGVVRPPTGALGTPPGGVLRPAAAPAPTRGPPPGGPRKGPPPTGPQPAPRTGAMPKPAPPPEPPFPLAKLDPDAPTPVTDWAKAIGQLMQLKSQISKIVIELGDKSRILYKTPGADDASKAED